MAQQTSRLHRLLTLLDTGSTSTTRRTAARQIGDIAKQHRGELRPLLRRVRQFLRSKSWDTRVAAAQAIGAIAENVPHPTVKDLLASAEAELGTEEHLERVLETLIYHENEDAALTFRRFDMQGVLENGAQLLSSGGQEYDVGVDNSKTPAERLARQKQNLRRRLGLDGCEQFMDVSDMIRDEDLLGHRGSSTGNGEASARDFFPQPQLPKQEVHQLVATMVPGGLSRTLSARERNMLKRKAKVLPKDGAKEWAEEEETEEPASKRTKQTKSVISEQPQGGDTKLVVDVVLDDENQEGDNDGEWPFNHIVELLIHDMFDSVWEVRHGSLMALREILSVQAASAGVMVPTAEAESESDSGAGAEAEGGAEGGAESVPTDVPTLKNKEPEEEIPSSSPRKESMIDLNVGISSEEENGECKKGAEYSSPGIQKHDWTGLPEAIDSKPDWMKADHHAVKTELSLGGKKPGTKLNHLKPEGLEALKSELNLDLGKTEDRNSLKPELNLDLGKTEDRNSLKPELNLDLGKTEDRNSLKPELNLDLGKTEDRNSLKPELNLDLGKTEDRNSLKPELNLDLGRVKPELSLRVVKQELGLDLNMEVELDLNMEMKEEPVTVKEEPLAVKEERGAEQEEKKLESKSQPNLFWQPHATASVIEESDSKAVRTAKKAWAANVGFLQDCTIRLLCVFALDRFGDYVSDQVVAPVRETCAQVMGAVMKQMPPALVHESLNVMLEMQSRPEWEVRHGSLLGIKYLVAVRQEMLQELLPRVLPACMAGLEDADDDVRAVAAEALTPAAAAIVASAGSKNVTAILLSLWDILLDLDDLSPSTSSVMHLLSELYSQPQVDSKTVIEKPMLLDLNEMMDDHSAGDTASGAEDDPFLLSNLAPRLWPFMRHNITSVRLAAIRTLERLLESGDHGEKGESRSSWAVPILGDALRMVFQNLLLESDETVIQSSQRVWRLLLQCPEANLAEEATAYLSSWLKLASTAAGVALEASKMYSPSSLPRKSRGRAVAKLKAVRGGTPSTGEPSWAPPRPNKVREQSSVVVGADGEKSAVHMRVTTAKALGILAASLPSALFPTIATSLSELLSSPSGTQRQVAAMVIVSWFKDIRSKKGQDNSSEAAKAVQRVLLRLLELLGPGDPSAPTPGSNAPYAELSRMLAKMRTEAGALVKHAESLGTFKRPFLPSLPTTESFSAEAAIDLATKLLQPSQSHGGDGDEKAASASDAMELARQRLLATAGYLQVVQGNLHMSVVASLASAVVWMGELPVKLNPVIQPLMAAIKREQEEALQQPAAEALAEVIVQCVGRKPSPNEKLIKNLCALTCADPVETPKATQINATAGNPEESESPSEKGNKHGKAPPLSSNDERARAEGAITRRGAELALKSLCNKFEMSLLDQLPKLWDCLTESLGQPAPSTGDQSSVTLPVLTAEPQALITNLQVVKSIAPVVARALHPKMLTLLPAIFSCVRHDHAAVRLVASKCLTAMAQTMLEPVMASVLTTAVPMLGDTVSVEARQGAGMLITALVEGLGSELVAYAPLLIVPLLGCMSDSNHHVRQSVTSSFAALVPLLPLARGVPPPKGLDGRQASRSSEDTRFLEQLLDNTQVDDYKLLVPLKVTLRSYQQEGINWLAFLKRFKLHGILCDDMGLGKTLQASAIVASDTVERASAFAVSKSPDVAPLPSLVICPSTLVGHWAYEIDKFIPADVLNPLQYVGSPQERVNLRARFSKHNIVILSYDVLRKDVDFLAQQVWNYCILDEGHIIKSSKSKITLAAKRIQADHRLLLSGTPIQNNVLELWSLFDFLMPGFLGTERQFQSNYGKPLQASREGKCSSKEAEAGVLAMEALHKQVMPFLLRRTKDEVLADLPPKIIQDRYCNLSPLQLQLYEDFSHSQAKQEVSSLVQTYGGPDVPEARAANAPSTHVFQALQYLRKLCSHPLLVLEDKRQAAQHADAIAQTGSKDLHELQHAPKLQALRDILEECGIGMPAAAETTVGAEGGQHRVLVFAQLKSFLDIIEKDLFQTHMKGVTYLRLDGSVESDRRFDIVKAFNSDPTIDVLLLTTHVGGLGLNLTAADTVVFMEHDWNPMRDLQAMDRAHRLGQKRVVNVHRLIMRGTLEEKIMSLQRFKISVANTVINAENASLNTMDTAQLLDLFTVSGNAGKAGPSHKGDDGSEAAAASAGANKGLKAILNNLEELWDQSQYTEEYNLGQFVARLNG